MSRHASTTSPRAARINAATPHWFGEDSSALYMGDCLELMEAIPDNSIDCVWTDPPYLLSNDGITCVAGRMVKVNKGDWDRSRGVDLDHEFNSPGSESCRIVPLRNRPGVAKPSRCSWTAKLCCHR